MLLQGITLAIRREDISAPKDHISQNAHLTSSSSSFFVPSEAERDLHFVTK